MNGVPYNAEVWRPYYAPSTEWSITNSYAFNDVVYNELNHYYRAIKQVPAGISLNNFEYWQASVHVVDGQNQFIGPLRNILVTVPVTPTADDSTTVAVMGTTYPPQLSWSTPQTQYITVTPYIQETKVIDLTNYLGGTNSANLVVIRNGERLKPPAGVEWTGDDVTYSFPLPTRIGVSQEEINADSEVFVWLNNQLMQEGLNYTVTPWTGEENRQVVFTEIPAAGDYILISVNTGADYVVNVYSSILLLNDTPDVGDVFSITTYNDTADQRLVTKVFVGPEYIPGIEIQGYNDTWYSITDEGLGVTEWNIDDSYSVNTMVYTQDSVSPGVPEPDTLPTFYYSLQAVPPGIAITNTSYWLSFNFTNLPGSFNYVTEESGYFINNFDLGRLGLSGSRLLVTLDGKRLFDGIDYDVQGQLLILASGIIAPGQVLVVTELSETVVPDEMAFRIFQDMRGLQVTYRITDTNSTKLVQSVSLTDDVIYVENASNLGEPDIGKNSFGVVTINSERIVYRYRDIYANTISGLWRGTAGTSITNHDVGSEAIDMGKTSMLDPQYQDYIDSTTATANGVLKVFTATNLGLEYWYDSFGADSIEVYVAGIRQFTGYTVRFSTAIQSYNETSYSLVDNGSIPVEWNIDQGYTAGAIVYTQDSSLPGVPDPGYLPNFYLAVKAVPADVDISNTVYWELVNFTNLPGSYNFDDGDSVITAVFFDTAPLAGVEVTILVRHGVTWYHRGVNTPSDGVPLQQTHTQAARFLCGH